MLYPLPTHLDTLSFQPGLPLHTHTHTPTPQPNTHYAQVYVEPRSVDDALVDLIYSPSNDPGAREVFVSVMTGVLLLLLLGTQGKVV